MDALEFVSSFIGDRSIGGTISAVRQNFRIPSSDICEVVGITESYLNDIETGKKSIDIDTGIKIALLFSVSPDVLLFPYGLENLHLQYPEMLRRAKRVFKKK